MNNTLQRRILTRSLLVFALIALAFVIIGAITQFNAVQATLQNEYETTLTRTQALLEGDLQQITQATVDITTNNDVRLEASRFEEVATYLSIPINRLFTTLIEQQPEFYRQIQFISPNGIVRAEVINDTGLSVIIESDDIPREDLDLLSNPDFQRALLTDNNQVLHIGEMSLLTNGEGAIVQPFQPVFSLFAPIYASNTSSQLLGLIRIEVDSTSLLQRVDNPSASNQILSEGRRLILLDSSNFTIADSGAQTNDFLMAMGSLAVSEAIDPVHQAVTDFSQTTSDNVSLATKGGLVLSRHALPLIGTDGGNWHLFVVEDILTAYRPVIIALIALTALAIAFVALAGWVLNRLLRPELEPIFQATQNLQDMAQGQRQPALALNASNDTAQRITGSMARLSQQISELDQSVTEETQRRTRDLQIAARIGRETATLYDIDELLQRSIELICVELSFYHAQVFFVDDVGINAVLTYSRGEAGRQMLEQGHKIRIGSNTVIGQVTQRKTPIIINDTEQPGDIPHGFNPLLPDTRAEMGLPLIIQGEVIGALDIQSTIPDSFHEDDLPTLQLLADQLAIAVHNARLMNQSQERIAQIDRLNRQLTRKAWDDTETLLELEEAYRYNLMDVETGKDNQNGSSADVDSQLATPITIRGEVIGTLNATLDDEFTFTESDQTILRSVAERVALAIENARLFQETQNSLAETSTLYDLSRQLNEASTFDDIIQSVILSVVPDAQSGHIWLFSDDEQAVQLYRGEHEAEKHQTIRWQIDEHPVLQDLTSETSMVVNNLRRDSRVDEELRADFELLGAEAVAFIPLNMRGVWRGFITIEFSSARHFSQREQRLYNALIDQAGVAIDNRLLQAQTQEALSRNEKLYSASRIINTANSMADLVYAAVATSDNTSANFWLATLEGERSAEGDFTQARIVAQSDHGVVQATQILHPIHVRADSPWRHREPEVLTSQEDTLQSIPREWINEQEVNFVVVFPLFADNELSALFYIVSDEAMTLSQEDYETYLALTGQMSTQIQNRQLLATTEQALNETRHLYNATRAIASAQDTEAIYQVAVTSLAQPFARLADDTLISITFLQTTDDPRPDTEELRYTYQWVSNSNYRYDVKVGQTIVHTDAPFGTLTQAKNEALLYQDYGTATSHPLLQDILMEHEAETTLVTRLQSRQSWFGVMIVRSTQVNAFNTNYLNFAQAIADQVATAIEIQRLFQETQNERRTLEDILSTLPAGVLMLDPYTYIPMLSNESVEALLGRKLDLTKPFDSSMYNLYRTGTNLNYPTDELPIYTALEAGYETSADDVAVIREDYHADLIINAAPIYDNRQNPIGIVAAFQDISNLRGLENTLQENLRETVAMYETQRALTEADNFEELLDAVLMQLVMMQPMDAYILLTDETEGGIHLARFLAQPLEHVEALSPILPMDNFANFPDIATNDSVPTHTREVFTELDIHSVMILPLRVRSRLVPLGWLMAVDQQLNAFTDEHERSLVSLGDTARTAMDNHYLVQSTQTALQETRSLYSATTTLTRARDLFELSDALEAALESLNADMIAGYVVADARGSEAMQLFKKGFESSEINGLNMQTLLVADLPQTDSAYISDITRSTLGQFEQELLKAGNIQAFAAVNLRVKDTPSGRLFVGYHEPHNFTEGETRFLNAVSDSASVVIDNQVLLDQIQSNLEETSVLYQASKALTDSATPDDILDVVVDYLIGGHVNQAFIALLQSPNWEGLTASVDVGASWSSDGSVDLKGISLNREQFPAWEQLASPTVLTIDDIEDESIPEDIRFSVQSLDARSLVVIPLAVPARSIGAIWIASQEAYHYSDTELRLYQSFAEQASLSLEAAHLLEQTERRARQLQTSSEVGQRVGQILDLDVLFPQVVELIKSQFDYDHVQIFLMDDDDDYAELMASTGEAGQQLLAKKHKLQKGSSSVIGRVTATGEPTLALDTSDANVVHRPNPILPLTRSEMALPIIIKGQVVGALDVQSNQPNAFGEEDIRALTVLTGQISVAIDNARLYADSQARANDMTFLFDITTAATAAENLTAALQTVTERVLDNLDASCAVMYLPQLYVDFEGNTLTMMKPVALAGTDQPLSQLAEIHVGDESNLIGIISASLQPHIVQAVDEDSHYLPIIPSAQSAILIPISSGGSLIGLVGVESERRGAFDEDDVQLLLTLSGSVAGVIENTQLLERLQQSNEQLRELDRLKSQFLASMSHELRTPLNSIIGFSRVMMKGIDGPLTEMQEQDLTTIYTSGQHLLNLINDILDQAKIEAGELDLKLDYFEVKPMIDSVKSMAIGLVKEKPVQLHVEVESSLPNAYGDEFRSRQILLNLVSNAVKFTQEGTVILRAYLEQSETQDTAMLRVDVVDTGIGIGEADIPILFERFRQVDSSLTRAVGGTGLGLPLSKSLAEMQGGELLVESEVNVGSVFSVTIPLEPIEVDDDEEKSVDDTHNLRVPDVPKPSENEDIDTKPDLKTKPPQPIATQTMKAVIKREVLLIEDNKEMVDFFRRNLQREGFSVQTADHPAYAEAMVGAIRPTFLIMDVNFGDGEGWGMLARLSQREDTADIPIIVTSMSDEAHDAITKGAFRFLHRPFPVEDFLAVIQEAEAESNRERILIVDDDIDRIESLQETLESTNYRVYATEKGKAGMSMVAQRQPNLILLDLQAEDELGLEMISELHHNPETAEIPIIVMTDESYLKDEEKSLLDNLPILDKTTLHEEDNHHLATFIQQVLNGYNGGNGNA